MRISHEAIYQDDVHACRLFRIFAIHEPTKPKQSNRTRVTPRNGLTDDETWIGPKPEFSATSAELLEQAA